MQHALAAIQVLDEFGDAAGEAELGFLARSLVIERDFQALIQKGQFAEALRERVDSCRSIALKIDGSA